MSKYRVQGGNRLTGEIEIGGSKNACLPILSAVVLADEPCTISNIPNISDALLSLDILKSLGATVDRINKNTVKINPTTINTHTVPHEYGKLMRASYYFLGSLLGQFHDASIFLPGGCNFGVRPIDQHLRGFQALGADIPPIIEDGMIAARAERLAGAEIQLDMVSVGATINIMLAAVKAEGTTTINPAAKEPHIVDVANLLNAMGADIRGAGTDTIKIRGVKDLHGVEYSVIPDQIEAGTFMACAVATRGDILLHNVIPKHMEPISEKLRLMGANVIEHDDTIRVVMDGPIKPCNIVTQPHPGFPTDMQPQVAVLLALAEGQSYIIESVWDNRFRYTTELNRMNANIMAAGKVAVINGVPGLTGTSVRALDLRAGAAMMIAALAAEGQTEIEDIKWIERGYENFMEKLHDVGADICRIEI